MTKHLTLLLCGLSVLAGCAKEPPPRTVTEFLENPILLEAAMVRCGQDRSKTRYDAECINARQAVARVQAKEEAADRAALDARSESKRRALRRTQAAAAEARRRAAEAQRLREEAEYLAQFGVARPDTMEASDPLSEGNVPVAVVPEAVIADEPDMVDVNADAQPAIDGGNAPVLESAPEPPAADLESIREELRRRNEDDVD
ncbi:MAG: EexN family lipoprotein [Gammaproteobacteria bacterium]|nr:EexN family lipoprotein [Gammaproteobacteria bacterium]MBT8111903.1 EexN family lipoprotein [Gammaproteobacteria bacterium]NND46771.1 EexN family lipoprotein [Woeseiaceae bacterium]NNL46602.1 EexN family lipoprotein [Woeseiaceae bacterium]